MGNKEYMFDSPVILVPSKHLLKNLHLHTNEQVFQ